MTEDSLRHVRKIGLVAAGVTALTNFAILVLCEWIVQWTPISYSDFARDAIYALAALISLAISVVILVKIQAMTGMRQSFWSGSPREIENAYDCRVIRLSMLAWMILVVPLPGYAAKFTFDSIGWTNTRLEIGLIVICVLAIYTELVWCRFAQRRSALK